MKYSLGRYLYGLAAIGSGICAWTWHDFSALGDVPHRATFVSVAAAIEILGGVAIQWTRTARPGAVAVGSIYLVFALLGVPLIVKHPLVYNGFGNFFEQFSFVAGAVILYACSGPAASRRTVGLARFGYYSFGVCVTSFALEQLFYLSATASLVPKWIPPGQVFWAIATTAAFAFAAIALLTGFKARLASQLTTAMILGFGLVVWLPLPLADPSSFCELGGKYGDSRDCCVGLDCRGPSPPPSSGRLCFCESELTAFALLITDRCRRSPDQKWKR